jgi:DNA-binding LacI/PurR family transcriptional regulator
MTPRRRIAKRPSSQDVADRAGVSRATVSAYINKNRYVSEELGERIECAIRELGYIPDPYARALKIQDAQTIGLIIPVLSRFFTPMMRAINEIAHRHRYGFLLSSSEEDAGREREVLEIMAAKRISGILLVPCSLENRELLQRIQEAGIPIVQVNRRIEGLDTDTVVSDNRKAAYTATEHLLRRGRKRIAFFGYDPDSLALIDKKEGYDQAIQDHGLADPIVILLKQADEADIEATFRRFLDSGAAFDGLVCTSQTKTSIALHLLKERGIRIPEEVAVVGFDDTPWASLLWRPLTVISESTDRMGEVAAQLLLERLERREAAPPPRTIVLEDELIVRDTT